VIVTGMVGVAKADTEELVTVTVDADGAGVTVEGQAVMIAGFCGTYGAQIPMR